MTLSAYFLYRRVWDNYTLLSLTDYEISKVILVKDGTHGKSILSRDINDKIDRLSSTKKAVHSYMLFKKFQLGDVNWRYIPPKAINYITNPKRALENDEFVTIEAIL